ncbi:PREDICTED: uncharacterized protein LOC101303634 [Fragaria vesca subsp. vesca]
MAEFPDHARLWLSSDTFFNDVVPSESNLLQSRFSSMDDLAHRLAALTLLKQRRGLGLQRFRPPVPTGYLDSQYCRSYLCGFCNGSGAHLSGTELSHHYPFPNPVPPQVGDGSFLEARARGLSMHHNQAQIGNQNRLFQFQGNGIAPMGVFERVSGGTGVFIPRVSASTITTMSPEVKKKPGE